MNTTPDTFDVAIIGGGAAGLAAAQALGRSRRSVVVIDAGEPRNAPAEGVHNFLTRDGLPPRELLALGRAEAGGYGVEFRDARATATRRDDAGFGIELEGGRWLAARRIILASGVSDQLPEVAGLAAYWGKNALHCPYCHGWEVRDRDIAVLDSPFAVHQALMFRQLSDRVTLFTAPGREFDPLEREKLEARGIGIMAQEIIAVRGNETHLTHLAFRDGGEQAVDALVVMPRFTAGIAALAGVGLQATAHPSGIGTHVAADETGKTEIPGLWAAGNTRDPMAQVMMAAADGLRVGAMVNADLIQEETDAAVAALRARAVV
ncbi:NAD(P)/FAD-dependent oxidoreductase [Paeniglutamicibacter sp. ABSL32-1]|uniref:NAD(P)/FAD-dependent oxidoreductase n=1 Tax=Paeniglutamicibacter quisquiliarum TaxID=2849498 RepID=UPI001C2DE18B|nr:NAD(P)/FAD-dependent oxidoreductase [Paeniglutamicibacter quisquiliarum]MBV1778344.1 NAD(P)/FAD-dependent oxidoreductase [Paeniglutamicibacter quisquiliarum]